MPTSSCRVRDGRAKGSQIERLREHSVGSHALTEGVGAAGHQDDPQIGSAAPQLGREGPPVRRAEVEIEEHGVHLLRRERRSGFVGRARLQHAVAVELEVDPAEQPDRGIVVDDENRSRRMDRVSLAGRHRRIRSSPRLVAHLKMKDARGANTALPPPHALCGVQAPELPTPTTGFRRRAWLAFQRALDPLAPPRPLPLRQHDEAGPAPPASRAVPGSRTAPATPSNP